MNPKAWLLPLVMSASAALATEPPDRRAELALGNVLYHHLQGQPETAFARAAYYQKRDLVGGRSREVLLTQAGLALDMGLGNEAYRLIDEIDPASLAAGNQDRLHYYLAKMAHQRDDLETLLAELGQIGPRARLLRQAEGSFLLAESDRLLGDLHGAREHAWRVPSHNVLSAYVLYNLGVSAWRAGDSKLAGDALERLVGTKARSLEQALLQERGKLALASMALDADRTSAARRALLSITATAHYGPAAIATLAQLAMGEEDFESAADLWRLLVTDYPWHEAARSAHVGLAYVVERASGERVALGEYRGAAGRLEIRLQQLASARSSIELIDPVDLAHALVDGWIDDRVVGQADGRAENNAKASPLTLLNETLGHADWSTWLTGQETTTLATRLQRLARAEVNLQQRQRDLEILLAVDARQQKVLEENASALASNNYIHRLAAQVESLSALQAQLDSARQGKVPVADFATAAELDTLATIDALAAVAQRTGQADEYSKRIARLRGLVLFSISDDLPVRIRQREAKVETMQVALDAAERRAGRVLAAAENMVQVGSVSHRVQVLDARTRDLLGSTQTALAVNGRLLMAGLVRGIERESAMLAEELAYAQLAMARIGDAQLLAAGVGQ